MIKYTAQRILLIILTIFIVMTINFFLLRLMPGTPFDNPKITVAQKTLMMRKYGLDKPMVTQYLNYLKNVVKGDFGASFKLQDQPVLDLILSKLPHTIRVGMQALIFGVIVGIIMGALAAVYKNSFVDHFVTIMAVIGVSIPSFVLAAFLQFYLCGKLGWFPYLYQVVNPEKGITFWKSVHSTILPSFALSLYVISSIMRFMRSELVEVLSSDFILLARAKGLSKPKVIFRHALRNALIPVVTVIGPMAISLLTGSLIIERFFGVPGLSKLLVSAITQNDYFLVLGVNVFYSMLFMSVILIIDLLYGVIDPRIRLRGGN